jgi:hypothetical protein
MRLHEQQAVFLPWYPIMDLSAPCQCPPCKAIVSYGCGNLHGVRMCTLALLAPYAAFCACPYCYNKNESRCVVRPISLLTKQFLRNKIPNEMQTDVQAMAFVASNLDQRPHEASPGIGTLIGTPLYLQSAATNA